MAKQPPPEDDLERMRSALGAALDENRKLWDMIHQCFYPYSRALFVCRAHGYTKTELTMLRADFLNWLSPRLAFVEGQNLLALQCAYDYVEAEKNTQAIQLGIEAEEVNINDLIAYLDGQKDRAVQ